MNEKVVIMFSVGFSFWSDMMSMFMQVITVEVVYKLIIKIDISYIIIRAGNS